MEGQAFNGGGLEESQVGCPPTSSPAVQSRPYQLSPATLCIVQGWAYFALHRNYQVGRYFNSIYASKG